MTTPGVCRHGEVRVDAVVGDRASEFPERLPDLLVPDDPSPWAGMVARVEIGECHSCATVLTRVAAFPPDDPEQQRWTAGWVPLTPPGSDSPRSPLQARAVEAVAGYRATGERRHLDSLQMDGRSSVAHDLTMERVHAGDETLQAPYTARIEEFLAGH